MHCPLCGFENKSSARFCVQCGAALADEPDGLEPGRRVGGVYRIVRPLGTGGMGAVYLAANTQAFDRPCVVKQVAEYYDLQDPAQRESALRRFESEARTLAALKSPGIPDLYAYFTEGGRNYLVMEYIEGENLAEGLYDGAGAGSGVEAGPFAGSALPVEDVVRYAAQICDVLIYLGERQPPVTHNDIKPANIILDANSGRAVLVDFGTAHSRYARPAGDAAGCQAPHGYVTTGYAAPELYEGRAEPRSDVYALAATVYHLLTRDDPRAHPCRFPHLDRIDEPLRGTLAAALEVDVARRVDAAQFKAGLQEALQLAQTGTLLAKQAPPRPPVGHVQAAQEPAPAPQPDPRRAVTRSLAQVVVRLVPPAIEVQPAQVALGRVGSDMRTETRTLAVRSRSRRTLRCRLEGVPAWLAALPLAWEIAPGQVQTVSLRGQAIGLQAFEPHLSATLRVVVGGHPRACTVRVSIRPQARHRLRRRRIVTAAVVGVASLTLAGLVVWLVFSVLPLL